MGSRASRRRGFLQLIRDADVGLAQTVAAIAKRLDPHVLVRVTPVSTNFHQRLGSSRLFAAIASLLGAVALGMACVGVFGVFAYVVQQRTREIGIRVALGAQNVTWFEQFWAARFVR